MLATTLQLIWANLGEKVK